jgi:hypothetical protein
VQEFLYDQSDPHLKNNCDSGVALGSVGGFNDVLFTYSTESMAFPVVTSAGINVDFFPQSATLLADGFQIQFPDVIGGAWSWTLHGTGAAGSGFVTGPFDLSGVGQGTDGLDYMFSFQASSAFGAIGNFALTSGQPGDPTVGIAQRYSIGFSNVQVSLDVVGSPQQLVSKGDISGVTGQIDCTATLTPEPQTLPITAFTLVFFAIRHFTRIGRRVRWRDD